jgi:transcriptional regulator with XRE-family HTH domain
LQLTMAADDLDVTEIGHRVRDRRLRLRRNQEEVAEQAGLDRVYVSKLENGRIPNPKIMDLRAVARALDMTLDGLLSERSPQSPGSSRLTPDDEAKLQALLRRPEVLPDLLSFLDSLDAAETDEDRRRLLFAFRVLASRHRFA